MALPFEFIALGWSKSLPPAYFVLTSLGRFHTRTSQSLAICSTMVDFYNKNLFDFGNFPNITVLLNSLGLVKSYDCHKSHPSKMVAIITLDSLRGTSAKFFTELN